MEDWRRSLGVQLKLKQHRIFLEKIAFISLKKCVLTAIMTHWMEEEVRELLNVRGEEEIRKQVTGTVKDATVYYNIAKILTQRGIKRTQQQVLNKLKSLRKQYTKVHDHNRCKSGAARMDWPFYDQCNMVFGHSPLTNPIALSSSSNVDAAIPTPPESTQTSEAATVIIEDSIEDTPELECSATTDDPNISLDELNDSQPFPAAQVVTDTSQEKQPEPVPVSKSTPGPSLRSNIYNVPKKRKRPNKMEQATKTMTTVMMDQLREMDSTMRGHENTQLQRFMDNERELQDSFLMQIMNMQERVLRKNRECMMGFMDRLLSRVQAPPSSPYYYDEHYPMYQRGQTMLGNNNPPNPVQNTQHAQPMGNPNIEYPPGNQTTPQPEMPQYRQL
ncbi:uncharacterized protein LOC142099305 [Mixophyes fleayi]|uniref:uncharacterized protein LOC142099305 n=1 Tax=Mixophyes fleayi TaxID=3061075 RepID=UPI003F4E2749